MDSSQTISHTYLPCLCPIVSPIPHYDWANGFSVDVFSCTMKMFLFLWRVGTILGNGYGIQGQNYVALF